MDEEAAADFFNNDPRNDDEQGQVVQDEEEREQGQVEEPVVVLEVPVLMANVDNYIEWLRAEGYGVDDDNDPAPENISTLQNEENDADSPRFDDWGTHHYCQRRLQNRFQEGATLNHNPDTNSCLDWFLKFLPVTYLQTVLIRATNHNLAGAPLDWPEFRFIGLLFLMSSVNSGCDRQSFFEDTEPSEFEGAPFRLTKYMSLYRFDSIIKALRYTNIPPPQFTDRKFHEIRQMISSFNGHMPEVFKPS
jgi:hypothetical protein